MGREVRNYDWIIITLLFLLAATGLFLLITTSFPLFIQQLFFLIIAALLYFLTSKIDRDFLIFLAPVLYIISIILLILTYFGPEVRGANRWLVIFGYQLQPSEIVKPWLMLFFAWFMHKYPPRLAKFLPVHLLVFIVPFFLIFKQPDLGSSIVYFSFWLAMMIAAGLRLQVIVITTLVLTGLLPAAWRLLAQYQKLRILTFLNPALDPKGAGYNALQAIIAIGSGQIFGRGLGRGTQSHLRFLPEFHTDFIFATLIEELGLAGGIFLLSLYALLLGRVLRLAVQKSISLFSFIYTAGLFTMILTQLFINAGMNMGILPVTGITLPLISYGGSSFISISIAFGLLHAVVSSDIHDDGVAIS